MMNTDNNGTIELACVNQSLVTYEIDQSVIVGLVERLNSIEQNVELLKQQVELLNNELNILKNPQSNWEANSKGGV